MRSYVLTTGTVFLLLTAAHIWRIAEEGTGLAREPWFMAITLAAAALAAWSWRVLRTLPRA